MAEGVKAEDFKSYVEISFDNDAFDPLAQHFPI